MATWLKEWNPEDEQFWNSTGKKKAWKTLWITTGALTLSFAIWFLMSALVVKLNGIGFNFSQNQLFWIAAMPGLSGGFFRIIHTFLLPLYGTRHIISITTLLKLIPCVGIGFAVMNTETPFWIFMVLALLTGFGGGDFSSYMPSTNLFFPQRLKGTALGIQAGIGNFGVSLVQFLTPVLIGFGVYGASAQFTEIDTKEVEVALTQLSHEERIAVFNALHLETQRNYITTIKSDELSKHNVSLETHSNIDVYTALPLEVHIKNFNSMHPKLAENILLEFKADKAIAREEVYLQSAAFWFVPILVLIGVLSWRHLQSVKLNASIKEQLDIFKDKHTWYCTIVYLMTFGGFAGLSAAFPMLIKSIYGGFSNAPDPLAYAFYGPLIGSAARVVFGIAADKLGGAILTTISGLGLLVGVVLLLVLGTLNPEDMSQFPVFVGLMLSLFFFTGIGNGSTFKQFPVIFSHNQRQAAGVIGWTAGVAAFGPFIFSMLIMASINSAGTAEAFFIGLAVFALFATLVNWYFYQRKGCERPS